MYVPQCYQKLKRLRYVSSPLADLHHFSIRHEFYAAAQIQTIIKTESVSFS